MDHFVTIFNLFYPWIDFYYLDTKSYLIQMGINNHLWNTQWHINNRHFIFIFIQDHIWFKWKCTITGSIHNDISRTDKIYPVSICIHNFETEQYITGIPMMPQKINNQNGYLSIFIEEILLISILYFQTINSTVKKWNVVSNI